MFDQSSRKSKLSTHTQLNIKVKNPHHIDSANLSSEEDIPEELSPVIAPSHMRKLSHQIYPPSK